MQHNCPLAILAPDVIGTPVATFIRRHMRDLLPHRTAVVARNSSDDGITPDWTVDGPVLDLSQIIGGRLRWQVAHAVAKQAGVRLEHAMIRRFLKRYQVQAAMGEYLDFSSLWLDTVRDAGIRFFAHAHGHDVDDRLCDPKWQAEYRRYNESDGIISNSRASRDRLVSFGLAASNVHVVYCGVDVPPEPIAKEDGSQIRCIAVGRVAVEKAPILLMDAFRRAARDCPRLRLDYVGAGPLLPAVQQFIHAFNLEDRVILHGNQSNRSVLALMAKADVFLQHSMQEGLGVAILEAMSRALPVVATRAGGILETVMDGVTGFLVEPGDSAGMAERIVALARDRDLRARMGLAGWRRAKECFTWERERAELLKIMGLEEYGK